MFKEINKSEVPSQRNSFRKDELISFLKSGYEVAEYIVGENESAALVVETFQVCARKHKLDVSILIRGERVFFVRGRNKNA